MTRAPLPQPQQGEGRQAYIERLSGLGFEVATFENSIPDLGRLSTPPHITISGELRPGFSAPVTQPAPSAPPAVAPVLSKALFKGSAAYKALSADLQKLVDLAFTTFSGTPEQQQIFSDALMNAQVLAEPYAKSQLLLFGAEFKLAIAKTKNDYAEQSEILTRARTDIAAELKLNQDNLTLEQTAAMAKELKGYDEDLLTIADQAAEKGITFATGARSRALAEERRGLQYQDVIQSTQRKYNFQIKDIELRAARGDVAAQKQLANLPGQQGFALQKIGQSAERVLGSTGVAGLGIGGFAPQGGALGDIEQERRKAVIDAARLGLPQ